MTMKVIGAVVLVILLMGAAPSVRVNADYVDDATCASCHAGIARSYSEVGMSRSFSRPRREAVIEDLGKVFVHAPSGQSFQMVWRDDRLVFRRYQRDANGKAANPIEQPVDWMLGSGEHARVYLYQTPEGELYQLPIAWYAQTKSWGMAPGYDRPDHDGLSRRVRHECMYCHNAYPEIAGSRDGFWRSQAFPKQLPEGIGCQRCHGPGAAHVQAMKAGQREAGIIHPGRLSAQRRNDVCNQCHLLPAVAVQGARRLGRDVYSFRPGQALSEYALPADITAAGGERFEISHQAYRMEQSRCFLESAKALSCLSCHNPHRPIAPAGRAAHFRKVCLRCHESMTAGGKEHAAETRGEADCVACHMPKRRTQDVVHVVMTDHRIGKYVDLPALLAPLGESTPEVQDVQLYDANVKGAERDLYRLLALLRAGSNNDPSLVQRLARTIAATGTEEAEPLFDLANAQANGQQWTKLEQTAQTILGRDPSQPLTLAWLGLAREGLGKSGEGIALLRRATAAAPERAGLHMNLALALIRNGKDAEALAELERATALRPNLAAAWLQLGELRMRRKETAAAIAAFQRVLAIEPADQRAAAFLRRVQPP
jgi:predicted CXXCH cytochrome family protein